MIAYSPDNCYVDFMFSSKKKINIAANTTIEDVINKYKIYTPKKELKLVHMNPLEVAKDGRNKSKR